jgi:hypothetical protein
MPCLIALIGRLPERAIEAIPALERIAANESEAPWTRGAASDVLRALSPGS